MREQTALNVIGVVKFWLGHENSDITSEYAEQIREDVKWRQRKATEIGVGFELPSIAVPHVPKEWEQEQVAIAV